MAVQFAQAISVPHPRQTPHFYGHGIDLKVESSECRHWCFSQPRRMCCFPTNELGFRKEEYFGLVLVLRNCLFSSGPRVTCLFLRFRCWRFSDGFEDHLCHFLNPNNKLGSDKREGSVKHFLAKVGSRRRNKAATVGTSCSGDCPRSPERNIGQAEMVVR